MLCGIYCRISTDQTKQKYSLTTQQELGIAFCESNKYEYKIYVEEESGKNISNREEFSELIEDIENKVIQIVWAVEFSRITRDDEGDAIFFKNLLIEYNVKLFALNEEIKFDSPEDLLFFQIRTAVSAYERRKLIERLKRSFKKIRDDGNKSHFNITGYDYDINNKVMVINDREADIVRDVFNLYIEGHSYSQICLRLDLLGHKKKHGGDVWRYCDIRQIISKPEYIGLTYNSDKELIKSKKFSKIIDKDIWNKAQQRRVEQQKTQKKNTGLRNRKYELSGIVKCEICGCPYYLKHSQKYSQKKGRYTHRYYCHVKSTEKYKACTVSRTSISMRKLELIMNVIYNEIFIDYKQVRRLLELEQNKLLQINDNQKEEIELYNTKIEELQKKRKRYIDGVANELWTMDEIKDDIQKLKVDIDNHKSKIKILTQNEETTDLDDLIKDYSISENANFIDLPGDRKKEIYLKRFHYITLNNSILKLKSITGWSFKIDIDNVPPYWINKLEVVNRLYYETDDDRYFQKLFMITHNGMDYLTD